MSVSLSSILRHFGDKKTTDISKVSYADTLVGKVEEENLKPPTKIETASQGKVMGTSAHDFPSQKKKKRCSKQKKRPIQLRFGKMLNQNKFDDLFSALDFMLLDDNELSTGATLKNHFTDIQSMCEKLSVNVVSINLETHKVTKIMSENTTLSTSHRPSIVLVEKGKTYIPIARRNRPYWFHIRELPKRLLSN
jgi:hypothetical protein